MNNFRRFFLSLFILIGTSLSAWPVLAVVLAVDPPGLQRAMEVQDRHTDNVMATAGVVGTAVGLRGDGAPTVVILMEHALVGGLPRSLEGVPVIFRVSGKVYARPRGGKPPKESVDPTARFSRPVPIGVSTGHPAITAGTIGARVIKGGNVYALSNNHVYANANNSNTGDAVIQPGTFDGGTSPADDLGTLFAYKPLNFTGGDNTIDAAIASTTTSLLANATPSDGYGTPKSMTIDATLNMKVKKYGRTTGFTKGQVFLTNVTVDVNYGDGKVARFVKQIAIQPGDFSAGGDSGSLIVVDGKGRNSTDKDKPVALLFAGSSAYTFANPIQAVLDHFGVTIDGD